MSSATYAKLERGEATGPSTMVVTQGYGHGMPVIRKGVRGMRVAVAVFSIVGILLGTVALALNVRCITDTWTVRHDDNYDIFPDQDTIQDWTEKIVFPVDGMTTPGIWFGVTEIIFCGLALVFGWQAGKNGPSACLTASGIILSIFFALMTVGACIATLFASFLTFVSDNIARESWATMFVGVTVSTGLGILVNLVLCVLVAVTLCVGAGCCCCSDGPEYDFPPMTTVTSINHSGQVQGHAGMSVTYANPVPLTQTMQNM